jgi:hypothetical protein
MGQIRNDLKTLTVDTVTGTQMNSAGGRIYLSNDRDLKEGKDMQHAIVALRTFGAWLQPDGGAIATSDGTSMTVRPGVGGQYVVNGVSVVNGTGGALAVSVSLSDGSNTVQLASGDAAHSGAITTYSLPYPLTLTNSLFLVIQAAGTVTMSASYHVSVRGV